MTDKEVNVKAKVSQIVNTVRQCSSSGFKEIKDAIFSSEHSGQCIQCHHRTVNPCVQAGFCSQRCLDNHRQKIPGRISVCKLPTCYNMCYVENDGRVHDYCTKTHAKEHEDMLHHPHNTRAKRNRKNKNGGNGNYENVQTDHGHRLGGGSGGSQPLYSQHTGSQCISGKEYGHSAWDKGGPVYFYNRNEPFYEFTNFYMEASPIVIDNVEWRTAEHYFQAQKFVGTPYVEIIRNAYSPREAFSKSRDPVVSHWRRNDWETVKENIMRKALWEKFTQKRHLQSKLLHTQERKLVEQSPHDSYWGDGGNGTGLNRLGELLMELRSKLQGHPSTDDTQRDGMTKSSHQASGQISSPLDSSRNGRMTVTGGASSLGNEVSDESNKLTRQPIRSVSGKDTEREERKDMPNLIDFSDNSTAVNSENINPLAPPFLNVSDGSVLTPGVSDALGQPPSKSDCDDVKMDSDDVKMDGDNVKMDVDSPDSAEDEDMQTTNV